MTLFIQKHEDAIFIGQLNIGSLIDTNWQTGQKCRPGAKWLEFHGPRPRITVVEVFGDEDISAVFATTFGERVEMSSRLNHSIDPELTVEEHRPVDFYYWRGLCVGEHREEGLYWNGGVKQLQWLRIDHCPNRWLGDE